uniref:HDC10968 n=1 Tax=Drosophila melanogaster TaxID=7227 RepID=Q6IKZ4_DROME|nr:TPA_inf: HDC10968 [Drosophila melanogaster]
MQTAETKSWPLSPAEEDVVLAVLLNWAKVWGSFLHYVATLDSNSNSKATWAIRALKKFVQRHRHRHSHRQQHHHHHHHDGRHQDNCETFVKRLGVEVFALFGCSSCGNCVRIVRRRHSGSHFQWKEQEQGKIAVETKGVEILGEQADSHQFQLCVRVLALSTKKCRNEKRQGAVEQGSGCS